MGLSTLKDFFWGWGGGLVKLHGLRKLQKNGVSCRKCIFLQKYAISCRKTFCLQKSLFPRRKSLFPAEKPFFPAEKLHVSAENAAVFGRGTWEATAGKYRRASGLKNQER